MAPGGGQLGDFREELCCRTKSPKSKKVCHKLFGTPSKAEAKQRLATDCAFVAELAILGQTSLKFSARLLHALPVRFLREAPAAASIRHLNNALVSNLSRTDQNYF